MRKRKTSFVIWFQTYYRAGGRTMPFREGWTIPARSPLDARVKFLRENPDREVLEIERHFEDNDQFDFEAWSRNEEAWVT